MTPPDSTKTTASVLLLLAIVFAASAWTLTFPRTPEGWSQLALLRDRSVFGALAPFDEYPYYRPLWFFWLSLSDRLGLEGGASHAGPLVLHLCGCGLLYVGLQRFGRGIAFYASMCAGVAPGLAGALSWLAAGNKAFVFCFLALGVALLLRKRGFLAYPLAIIGGSLPAIASSENGYLTCVLFPFVVLFARPRDFETRTKRVLGASLVGTLSFAIAACHLFYLSPQRAAGPDDRLGQLREAWTQSPFTALGDFGENLGRFFLHGLGVADDAPVLGGIVLILLFGVACRRPQRGVLLALVVFVILNVPASFFANESSRHHAYLPAVGAGIVIASLLWTLPVRAFTLPLVLLFFLARGFDAQRPWADYCAHSARVFASSVDVLPDSPLTQPLLVNVPEEYRAAFYLRFGPSVEVDKWPAVTVLSSRTEVLLPPDWTAPPADGGEANEAVVIEYDGQRLVRSSLASIAKRHRAPQAFFVGAIRPFERPWLAWGETLGRSGRLVQDVRGFDAPGRLDGEDDVGAARAVRVDAHGPLEGEVGLSWDCTIAAGSPAWLVLGWTPWNAMPTTENAWLFTLARLPWAFELRVYELDEAGARNPIRPTVQPAYGFLPAFWCDGQARRIRAELRLR